MKDRCWFACSGSHCAEPWGQKCEWVGGWWRAFRGDESKTDQRVTTWLIILGFLSLPLFLSLCLCFSLLNLKSSNLIRASSKRSSGAWCGKRAGKFFLLYCGLENIQLLYAIASLLTFSLRCLTAAQARCSSEARFSEDKILSLTAVWSRRSRTVSKRCVIKGDPRWSHNKEITGQATSDR